MSENFLKIETLKSRGRIKTMFRQGAGAPVDPEKLKTVAAILESIEKKGADAVLECCRKYDGQDFKTLEDLRIKKTEFERATECVCRENPGLADAIHAAAENIRRYHEEQLKYEVKSWYLSWPGQKSTADAGSGPGFFSENAKKIKNSDKVTGQRVTPLKRAGLYIPGGRYLYPSSVLMAAIPAKTAGVKQIFACSPPRKDGKISDVLLHVFNMLGVSEVYKIGGAQAIGLMAYGAGDVERADKIAGPGNIYVTLAKRLVYGRVGIDSLAGPSEIAIIADKNADAGYAAADLLSQAEHDPDAACMLFTTDMQKAEAVIENLYLKVNKLKNEYGDKVDVERLSFTLKNNCRIFYSPDMDLIAEAVNFIAPEHLEILSENFESISAGIENAGAVFLGPYSPVAAGDYISGTNHIIPTSGSARFSSPLGVGDFLKRSSFTYYSRESLKKEAGHIECLAGFENLLAHKNSVAERFEEENER